VETMISWLALVVGGAAIAYAWKLQQELQTATRRLDRYNRALFDASDEIRKVREELTAALAQVRAESRLPSGAPILFTPQMKVRDALVIHPQAEQILAAFHLGGCSSCAVDANDTLTDICREHGRDLAQLLQNLNLLVAMAQQPNGQPSVIKVPNVELSF
jgi:hybrid cluster-associated redox disulfide protein